MSSYRTAPGDMIDEVLWRLTGSSALTEAVLDMNPGLAALGPVLPGDVVVQLPEPAPAVPRQPVRLWSRT